MHHLRDPKQDHPHLRGENPANPTPSLKCPGSPPLTWGKLYSIVLITNYHRITPTYVGKTTFIIVQIRPMLDHPHLRGENRAKNEKIPQDLGSPPLTWGKRYAIRFATSIVRITPTYVGKTSCIACFSCCWEDHPHLRGENDEESAKEELKEGSPPLTWGKPPTRSPPYASRGITPTYVGKTC